MFQVLNRSLAGCGVAALAALCLGAPASASTVTIPFDADNFDNPTLITNQFLPLEVGAIFIYKSETPDGCEWSQVTVTNDTKDITVPGQETIAVRVVEDFEYEDEDCGGINPDELVEKTFDWFGQDDVGNIWYFGEDTFNCDGENDCELGGGTWEAGKDGALPGIIMLGDPDSGERYRQEFAEDVAEDWGMVMNLNGKVRLRSEDAFSPSEFGGCLVTKEWNDLQPGSVEQKTYCPTFGLVLIEEHSGKLVRFELTDDSSGIAGAALQFRKVPNQ